MAPLELSDKDKEIQKLLAIASQPAGEGDVVEPHSAKSWVIAIGLKAGNDKVQPYLLWYNYKLWAKDPIKQLDFFKEFRKLFVQYSYSHKTASKYYKLDSSVLNLSIKDSVGLRKALREMRESKKQNAFKV